MTQHSENLSSLINHSRASIIKVGAICIGVGSLISAAMILMTKPHTASAFQQSLGLTIAGILAIAFFFRTSAKSEQADHSLRNLVFIVVLVYIPDMIGNLHYPFEDHERTFIVLGILFGALCMSTPIFLVGYAIMLAGWHLIIQRTGRTILPIDVFYMWLFAPAFGIAAGRSLREHLQGVFKLQKQTNRRAQELATARVELSKEQNRREVAEQERLAIEDTIKLQHEQLLHVSRTNTMGEMVAGIAHEINQPLNAISMNCGILSHPNSTDVNRKAVVGQISDLTDRCGKIIRRLQGFVRRDTGAEVPVDLANLVNDSIALAANVARQHNIEVVFKNDYDGELSVVVDEIQIQQVLVNLQQNAFESMVNNEPEHRKVTIAMSGDQESAQVSVSDQGDGIDDQDIESVFEAFVTSKSQGLGMGLAISRSIVERYNGTIDAVRNEQRGSTFTFSLPRNVPSVTASSLSS